ncbi:MAG: SpoIIE family protein phosphatase [Caldilineaceae bacterium]|nr:SpoIIE family protein phosphatase [Caldilineaceae bacterium]
MPAALVMATTRTLIRAAAERLVRPGNVLERVNHLLHPDIPPKMFVTCLYAVLNLESGHLIYANAGHDVPYRHTANGVEELRATGMPLGLMPGMHYEEKETVLEPGESILLYSDGLVEAHNEQRGMFGFPRLQQLMDGDIGGADLVPFLLGELVAFTGPDWEQEDDVTLVVLQREHTPAASVDDTDVRVLASFEVESAPGNERDAMQRVADAVAVLDLPPAKLERLKTAVAEATMNAMEHGNQYDKELPVQITVSATKSEVIIRIVDQGGEKDIPISEAPDLEAKLAGMQTPRGWGLFLIQNMVDRMHTSVNAEHHIVELFVHLEQGGPDAVASPKNL